MSASKKRAVPLRARKPEKKSTRAKKGALSGVLKSFLRVQPKARKIKYDFENCATRLNCSGPYYPLDVEAALRETEGNFAQMAELLGRKRTGVRDYVLANIALKDIYDELRATFLDRVEGIHDRIALTGDGPALRFLLQTLGKDRGYTTRQETTGRDGEPLVARVNVYLPDNGRGDAPRNDGAGSKL